MGILIARLVMALLVVGVALLIGGLVLYGYRYLRRRVSARD